MDSETIFAILVGAALACFGLAMVGYSFFRRNEVELPGQALPPPEADGVGLDSLLDSVDTLELEFQLGNVPEEQYLEQLRSYRLQIAALVKEQFEKGVVSPELALEQEVQLARSRMNERTNGSWRSCPRCDAPLPGSPAATGAAVSCPHCGALLDDVADSSDSENAQPADVERAEIP